MFGCGQLREVEGGGTCWVVEGDAGRQSRSYWLRVRSTAGFALWALSVIVATMSAQVLPEHHELHKMTNDRVRLYWNLDYVVEHVERYVWWWFAVVAVVIMVLLLVPDAVVPDSISAVAVAVILILILAAAFSFWTRRVRRRFGDAAPPKDD